MSVSSQPISASASDHFDYLTGGISDPRITFRGQGYTRYIATGNHPDLSLGKELFLHFGEGIKPDGKLIQRNYGKHTTGIDVPVSAPKWFSTLVAISNEQEQAILLELWDNHTDVIFDRLEKMAKVCKPPIAAPSECERSTKQKGSKTERVEAELIAFKARHQSARPTLETEDAGRVADVHIHDHFFIFNMAWSHGKWRAVDDDGIKRIAGQMAFESEGDLARLVEDMGYRPQYVEDRRGGFRTKMDELADLSLFWSSNKRREQQLIREYEKKHLKPPTDEYVRAQVLYTRHSKPKDPEPTMDWSALLEGARAAGMSVLNPLTRKGPLLREPLEMRQETLRRRVFAANGVCGTANNATFGYRKLSLAFARCAVGLGLTLEEQDAFKAELIKELVEIKPSHDLNKIKWTTPKNWDDEWFIYRSLDEHYNRIHSVPTPDAIERAILRVELEKGITFDAEQREIIYAACESNGLLFIEGFAGTGKTVSMLAVTYAFLDKSSTGLPSADQIVAISTARDTALRTGEKLAAKHCDSIESFVDGVMRRRIRPTEKTVIVVDEYIMVDNDRMAKLLKAAGPAKIICLGDRKQLQSIGAGGWGEDAVRKYGCKTLTNVHRQENEEDVLALFNLRSGRAAQTLESLMARDRVFVLDDPSDRVGAVIEHMIQLREEGRGVKDIKIVMDGKNTDIDGGNRIVQNWRLSVGELSGEPTHVYSEKSEREWDLYVGDEVSFIEGYFDAEKRLYIANGVAGRIVGTREGELLIESDRLKEPTWIKAGAWVCPSYFIHATRLQGGEAPIILAMPGAGTTSLEAGYSQASRCIEAVFVYLDNITHGGDEGRTNPVEMIINRWKDSRPKISARTEARRAGQQCRDHVPVESHLDKGPLAPMGDKQIPKPYEHRRRRFVVDTHGIGLEM